MAVGGGQLLLQGGHNPDLPVEWYEDLFRAVKERYPTFKLHALSPPEVIHLTRLSGESIETIIDRLVAAGLDSIPGGGAEILGIAYGVCSTATARPRRTSGSRSCAWRTGPVSARRRR